MWSRPRAGVEEPRHGRVDIARDECVQCFAGIAPSQRKLRCPAKKTWFLEADAFWHEPAGQRGSLLKPVVAKTSAYGAVPGNARDNTGKAGDGVGVCLAAARLRSGLDTQRFVEA